MARMNMIPPILLLLLIFTTSIWSDDKNNDIQAPSIVEYMNGAVPFVHDTVSIISGAWLDHGLHSVDKAVVEPYRVGHVYSSNSLRSGTLADGWEFFHPTKIHVWEGCKTSQIHTAVITVYHYFY